jgi:hypothetical protein
MIFQIDCKLYFALQEIISERREQKRLRNDRQFVVGNCGFVRLGKAQGKSGAIIGLPCF